MAKYTFECNMGHEPMMLEVEAATDEEAMTMMMDKAKAHLAEMPHEGAAPMDDEAMKKMIMDGWKKEEM